MPETETLDIFVPFVQGLVDVLVLLVFQDIPEDIAEETVARHHDGLLKPEGRPVVVAPELMASEVVSLVAWIGHIHVERSFLETDETVDEFEH